MAGYERLRETVSEFPSESEIERKAKAGWKLVAVEWQREAPGEPPAPQRPETPYGLLTPEGGSELERDVREEETLRLMLDMVIDDRHNLAAVADELNRRGLKTRAGDTWSQLAVFNMLPRLIEVAPRLFSSSDDSTRAAVAH